MEKFPTTGASAPQDGGKKDKIDWDKVTIGPVDGKPIIATATNIEQTPPTPELVVPENQEVVVAPAPMQAEKQTAETVAREMADLAKVREQLGIVSPQENEPATKSVGSTPEKVPARELTEAEALQRDFDRNLKSGKGVSEYLFDAKYKGINLEYDEGELKNALTAEAASSLQQGYSSGAIKAISMGERLGFQIEFDKDKMKQAMEMSIKTSIGSNTDPFYLTRQAREWGISIDTKDEKTASILKKKFLTHGTIWYDLNPENAKTLIEEGVITYKELPKILNDEIKEVLRIGNISVKDIGHLATEFESKLGIRIDLSDPKLASMLEKAGYKELVDEYGTESSGFKRFMERIGLKRKWIYSYGLNRTDDRARAEDAWMERYAKN